MHTAYQRTVNPGQAPRANHASQHPRHATIDSRDPSLTLAPLRSPSSIAPSTVSGGQKRTSTAATAEAQIMSIPAVNKLRLLSKAAPPLPYPGAMSKITSPSLIPTPQTRGAILAIEGSEEDARVMTEWLAEFLKNESDEFLVRAFLGPDISAVMGGSKTEEDSDLVGTQQQRYLKAISEWHWVSKEVVKFVTTVPNTEDGTFSSSETPNNAAESEKAPRQKQKEMEDEEEEMDLDSSSSASSSPPVSPTSAVSPRTISRTERLNLKSPTMDPSPLPPPAASQSQSRTQSHNRTNTNDLELLRKQPSSSSSRRQQPPFPIALLPRYQLSTVDTASIAMPITDSYLPIDHWQWAAALWRGCVGADVTVVVQEERAVNHPSTSNSGAGVGGSVSSAGTAGGGGGASAGLGGSVGGSSSGGGVERG